jgi:RNA polymerase sigma-70 factor (ECF subfamily)
LNDVKPASSRAAFSSVGTPPEATSFPEVYRRHAEGVWRVLRRLGVREADVADVCQEVFTVIYRKLPHFTGRSTLRTWIYGIAVRSASDYRRRAHVLREVPTEMPGDQALEAPQIAFIEQREARAQLDALIAELDEDKRAVFVLFEMEEFLMSEVADAVGCPLQTAYSRLHAARRQLEGAVARLQLRERSP